MSAYNLWAANSADKECPRASRQQLLYTAFGSLLSCCCLQYLTRQALAKAGLPTPRNSRISKPEDIEPAGQHVGFPAVIKPVAGTPGQHSTQHRAQSPAAHIPSSAAKQSRAAVGSGWAAQQRSRTCSQRRGLVLLGMAAGLGGCFSCAAAARSWSLHSYCSRRHRRACPYTPAQPCTHGSAATAAARPTDAAPVASLPCAQVPPA